MERRSWLSRKLLPQVRYGSGKDQMVPVLDMSRGAPFGAAVPRIRWVEGRQTLSQVALMNHSLFFKMMNV